MALQCSWIVVLFFLPGIIECGNDGYQSLCGIISKSDFIQLGSSLVYSINDGTNEVCIVQSNNITITSTINSSIDVYCTNDYSVVANGNSTGGLALILPICQFCDCRTKLLYLSQQAMGD